MTALAKEAGPGKDTFALGGGTFGLPAVGPRAESYAEPIADEHLEAAPGVAAGERNGPPEDSLKRWRTSCGPSAVSRTTQPRAAIFLLNAWS